MAECKGPLRDRPARNEPGLQRRGEYVPGERLRATHARARQRLRCRVHVQPELAEAQRVAAAAALRCCRAIVRTTAAAAAAAARPQPAVREQERCVGRCAGVPPAALRQQRKFDAK